MSRENRPEPGFEIVESAGSADTRWVDYPRSGPDQLTGGSPGGEGGSIPIRRYLSAVYRYKWWILLLAIVATAAGAMLDVKQILAPEYEAEATIWVETSGRDASRTGPIRSEELLRSTAWIDLLRSFQVLDPVVLDMQLLISPDLSADSAVVAAIAVEEGFVPGRYVLRANQQEGTFALESPPGTTIERGVLGEPAGRAVGLSWVPTADALPADRPVVFTVAPARDVSRQLGRRLYSQLDRNGNFLRLRLRGSEPAHTAAVLNRVVDRYVEVAADLKGERLDEVVAILQEQLTYAEDNLRAAEMALQNFRVQTATLPSDRPSPMTPGLESARDPFSNFYQMRLELEQVRSSQEAIQRAIDPEASQGLALQTLEAVGAVRQSSELTRAISELTTMNAELRALLYRYTPEHPPVQALMGQIRTLERTTIPALAADLLAELATQERQLETRIAGASVELRQVPPRAIEEARLSREVAIADNLYTTLQRRYEEARLAAASSFPDVRILDRAVAPRQPLGGERKTPLALFTLLGSLALGIVGAIMLDRTDSRLRYPQQVTHELGLYILGAVPRLRGRRRRVREEHQRQALEAFRSIRLSLSHAYGAAGPMVLTVTSPGPGDGKSFITANLARSFAQLGRRTLVVDGDVRRGTVHQLLGVQRTPGLTNHLRGKGGSPLIQATTDENLSVLASGSRVGDGPDLLNTRAMRDLVLQLRADYDVILLDSPPLGAGVDAFALGTLAGSMLLVLRTGITDRELADAKLEVLDRLPIRLLGAVLNGVPSTREYRYYAYESDYASHDEAEPGHPVALPVVLAQ